MFIDETRFRVTAGDGGNGCVAWRREKYVPRGGPYGGDGGRGGDVVLVADLQMRTLLDLHRRRHIKAERGGHGMSKMSTGANGHDAVIHVPVGCAVYDEETGEQLGDLVEDGQRLIVAKGGKGGLGNSNFATPTRQAPDFATPGTPAESRMIRIELKVLADLGIIGFPSVGKSTLISRISNARPKVAAYPFTTLQPNLGLVRWRDHQSYVVADLPGLIEGAHEGRGLGHQFLRHLERVRAVVHVIEVPETGAVELGVERDPVRDYEVIRRELAEYDPRLAELPEIVVLNKIDLPEARERAEGLRVEFEGKGRRFLAISAATGEGIGQLIDAMGSIIETRESSWGATKS